MGVTRLENSAMGALAVTRGDGYRAVNAPSTGKTFSQGRRVNPQSSSPVCLTLSFAKGCKHLSSPLVTILLWAKSPANVAHFIVPIIVDSIQRVLARRSTSNVLQQVPNVREQEPNPSAPIIVETFTFRVFTSIFSRLESSPFGGSFAEQRLSVRDADIPDTVIAVTATRNMAPMRQVFRRNSAPISAVADAMPHRSLVDDASKSDNKKSPKFLTSKNFDGGIDFGAICANGKLVSRHFVQSSFLNNLASRVAESYRFLQPAFILT